MTGQDRRMRAILARLELCSHGAVTSYNPSGGQDMRQRDFGRPPGEQFPWHDEFREAYLRAVTDDDREQVISDARGKLEEITRSRPPERVESEHKLREDIIDKGEGWSVADVALAFRCLQRFVREVRRAAGRDEASGARVAGRACEHCGKPLKGPVRASRKWCDDSCKMRAARARAKEAA